MGIHGVSNQSPSVQVHSKNDSSKAENKPAKSTEAPSLPLPEDTADISQKAKDMLENKPEKAGKPHDVAESLGYSNFGQLVKAIRHAEGGEDVSISKLVHQDADTLNQVQALFAEPQEEPAPTEEPPAPSEETPPVTEEPAPDAVVDPTPLPTPPTESSEVPTEPLTLPVVDNTTSAPSDLTLDLLDAITAESESVQNN
jgi:hypothetical protein